ncbi:unnamed protein product [Rotaria socialis]|nr:unnamed protein product [Rotaria socialis]CAF4492234.1 unnamed protein product [Rotaria socialis]
MNNFSNDSYIVWLDNRIEASKSSREIKSLIRQLARGRLFTSTDPDECVDYILDELATKKVCFIVSNALGPNVVPLIYGLPQIQKIYVFCGNRQAAESWVKPHFKISGIFTEKKKLLHQIGNDIDLYGKDDDLPMSVFHLTEREQTLQKLTQESATFMWYRAILMVLRSMAKYNDSKTEMIVEAKAIYRMDEIEQKKIKRFEDTYCPTEAFWWYTYDSFVYRLLNKALRTQEIEIIFKFRFFIDDLCNQIEQSYYRYLERHSSDTNHELTVYRGQRSSMTDVNLMKNNVNELISMNSFLSTTLKKAVALLFADTSDQSNESSPLQSVLFIIDISNMSKEMTSFAFIQTYSCCPDEEEEVIFSIGAIFKVQSVELHENMWHVHLKLSKEQNQLSQHLFDHMIKQIGVKPSPLSFGWFLYRINKFNNAERYAKMMLEQLPPNDRGIGDAYNLLGLIYNDIKRLDKSIEYYEKALEIYSKLNSRNSAQAIATRCSLGLAYLALGDIRNAEDQQTEAEESLINSAPSQDPLLKTKLDSLKARIQLKNGDDNSALNRLEQILENKRSRLPSTHPSLGGTISDIGTVHEKLRNYPKALEYFEQALSIVKKSLPSNHLDLVDHYINVGGTLDKLGQYQRAVEKFTLALNILEEDERENVDRIEEVNARILETTKKLHQ